MKKNPLFEAEVDRAVLGFAKTMDQHHEEETKKVTKLIAIPGGKDGGDDNWLENLEVGTAFLAARRMGMKPPGTPTDPTEGLLLDQYQVVFRKGMATRLYSEINQPSRLWVNTLKFSRTFELKEVLGVVTDDGIATEDQEPSGPSGLDYHARVEQTDKKDET